MNRLKSIVEEELGIPITDTEMKKAEQSARRKLDWIISREGDAEGKRLETWYLVQLIIESISQNSFSVTCYINNA